MATIRPRTEADLHGCVDVLRHVYVKNGYPVQGTENAKAFLYGGLTEQAWVAERDGRIVGHVAVSTATDEDIAVALYHEQHPDDAIAVLERLFVHPEYRKGGVATQLMDAAVSWSREVSKRLVLFALVKDQTAIGFYGRQGWTNFGSTTYHYADGEHMAAVCFASPSIE